MADQAVFRMQPAGPTVEQTKRADQQRRRNLRIAIRQLERAELYLVALYSLDLEDRDAARRVDELVVRLRSLERYLVGRKLTA
jgi:hypothetical protein